MSSSPNSQGLPPTVARVIDSFSRLPGIGPKTASRLTFFLLRSPDEVARTLAEALADLKAKTQLCSICYNITDSNVCSICSDTKRDKNVVVVVEEPLDLVAIERTGMFKGRYHVLHGAIRPVEGIGPDDLKIKELLKRVEEENIVEVIIATNPNTEGEATAFTIQRYLANSGVKVTRLARGLPTGSDLEYVDTLTLTRALQGRSEMS
ncbi:MAG: recombination mediator RecR [Deltaproteobacteria bacterium]|nr:recombination mediator RecR [Candidatus Kapabacteria bacterium]